MNICIRKTVSIILNMALSLETVKTVYRWHVQHSEIWREHLLRKSTCPQDSTGLMMQTKLSPKHRATHNASGLPHNVMYLIH